MSVKTILPAGQLGSPQLDNGYSRGVWHDCPIQAIRDGELPGNVWEFNFDTLPKTPATTEGNFGLFSQFSDTGGFINAVDSASTPNAGGWSFGSDGDNEGASIRGRALPWKISRTNKKFWFEVRIKTSTITDTKHNIFVGLMEDTALSATVPITATGTLADKNLVGFQRPETARSTAGTGGAIMNTVYKCDGVAAVTVQNDAVSLTASTYVNLGMVFDPGPNSSFQDPNNQGLSVYNLAFFANGIQLANAKQIPSSLGTDFPNDISLSFVFAVLNATGTTPGDSTINRARIAQLY